MSCSEEDLGNCVLQTGCLFQCYESMYTYKECVELIVMANNTEVSYNFEKYDEVNSCPILCQDWKDEMGGYLGYGEDNPPNAECSTEDMDCDIY